MKFKKDGLIYTSFVDAVNVFFLGDRKIFTKGKKTELEFPDDVRQSMIWAYENADMGRVRLNAKLMGYEVIDDTPDTREAAAKRGEDVNRDAREAVEKRGEDVKHGENAKRKLTRADILRAAEKCVCGQRETDYGTPEDNFKAIAELWNVYLDRISVGKYGNTTVDEKDVAVMMALLKIARIARGGGKADSWIDLAGYAACGAECEGVTE